MKKSGNSVFYLAGSVILIVVAITATALVNVTRTPRGESVEVRAKAASAGTLRMTGVISSIDEVKGLLAVDNFRFASENGTGKSLGSWSVTPPGDFRLSSVSPGMRITLTIFPSTFLAGAHTVTASQIMIEK